MMSLFRRFRMKSLKSFGENPPRESPRLSLCDTNPDVARVLAAAFAGADGVEVLEGNLLDLGREAVLSPANSFGDMGGGIDKHIDDFLRRPGTTGGG